VPNNKSTGNPPRVGEDSDKGKGEHSDTMPTIELELRNVRCYKCHKDGHITKCTKCEAC